MRKEISCILMVIAISIGCSSKVRDFTYEPTRPDYWPTKEWRISTPEEQGMDSEKILQMVEYLKKERIPIDSITIVRNGYIVSDIYLNPLFPKKTKHIIHSCTKSIMSALIGIAIDKGYIKDVNVRVLDIFKDIKARGSDHRMRALTLKDLLTMQTGIRSMDSYLYEWKGLFKMMNTDNWTEFALNLPMDVESGIRFDYSNISSFLLSAIITKKTGMDTLSFARRYLFDPLGIKDIQWAKSPRGIYIGWARIWLKPHDMAKIGLLYLQKGRWGKGQIVSAQWVEESTSVHALPKKFRYLTDEDGKKITSKSIGVWLFTNLARPFSDGYGYQWWIDKMGMYTALGHGGQFITVVPQKNMVIVFASKLRGRETFIPVKMYKEYILPAVVSDKSITAKKVVQDKLSLLSDTPEPVIKRLAVPELPPMALKISDKLYLLKSNPWQYNRFKLTFKPEQDYVVFNYTKKNEIYNLKVGLDNVYRLSKSNNDTYASKGSWTASNIFAIEYEIIGYSSIGTWTMIFDNDEITIEEFGPTGSYTYTGKLKK